MEVVTDLNLCLGCLETLAHNETDLSRAFQQPPVAFISNQSISDEGNRRLPKCLERSVSLWASVSKRIRLYGLHVLLYLHLASRLTEVLLYTHLY